jgi:hypothetical protein
MVTASSMGQMGSASVNIASVSDITYHPDARTKAVLGTLSSGRETSTQVFFKVVDSNLNGVGGVGVSYELEQGGAAGATVSPQSYTDDGGIAYTTLTSGDGIGIATIHAIVSATIDAGMLIDTTHPGTPIVLGKPSGEGFGLSCAKVNLGALHVANGSYPPTRTQSTTCTATLADRVGNPVGLPTSVQFFAENGVITSPIMSDATGKAVSTYSTTSSTLPIDVTPIAGEPDLGGGKNPRDMTVTIIAIVSGSEEFYDGSGGGTLNGKWDPGEWFVDLPEPYIDANDNGTHDPGETFFDSPRLNCQTQIVEPPNGVWDGPNGCQDTNTQLWRVFHVQWSGPLVGPLVWAPSSPPFTVPAGVTEMFNFSWCDAYGSPLSADSASITAMQVGNMVGTIALTAAGLAGDSRGYTVNYNLVEATETDAGSGVFVYGSTCNPLDLPGVGPGPLTRCLHTTSFTNFGAGNGGTLTINGRSPGTLADGGVRPATVGTVTMNGSNSLSTPVMQVFTINYQ